MPSFTTNLLRRTSLLLGAAAALVLSLPAAAQGTATLSTGQSCVYSSMTVLPNGSISISCNTTSTSAAFSLVGATTLALSQTSSYQIARSGGAEATIDVNWNVTGAGCVAATGTVSLAAGASATFPVTAAAAAGSCTIAATPGTGIAPANLTVTVGSTAPPPPTGNCPTPQVGYIQASLPWGGSPNQLRMASGVIASYPLIAEPNGKASIVFTQGQQPNTPASVTTELNVSKCPGVIDTAAGYCYRKSGFVNNNAITSYTKPVDAYGWNSQATLGSRGCWAPLAEGPWYVNVRWTYGSCPYTTGCGFSHQWASGSW